jgi:predicted house-cleaning noncanonical NTP pyrophosphatase (MazG superfamily)
MTKYNKLIRSKVPEYLDSIEVPYKIHIATADEYKKKLTEKLLEEAFEFAKEPVSKGELADILEVIEAIKESNGWTTEEIEEIRLKKHAEKGGFDQPIILEES